ncbi:hypothetical protein HK098_002487 [Nowakowskiella sp. JEL0407]|nr:hypothetical protein HK098_002487 [Nowakowskiella sp. JEL0407]
MEIHSLKQDLDIAFQHSAEEAKDLHDTLEHTDYIVDEYEKTDIDLEDILSDGHHSASCEVHEKQVKHFIGRPAVTQSAFDPSQHDYMNQKGYVHSVDTLGSLEGPGNRFLVFLNGCKARCLYCENPDTWEIKKGATEMVVSQLIDRASHFAPYYTKGGVTISGGDPMVQFKFCASLLYAIHKHLGFHTCIETTGQTSRSAWDAILPHADLVLLCLKGTTKETYKRVTKTVQIEKMLEFIKELEFRKIEWWCRYVVVPGFTDSKEEIEGLIEICKDAKALTRIEFLPYHTLGEHKVDLEILI